MKTFSLILFAVGVLIISPSTTSAKVRTSMIVTTEWLGKNLNDPHLVLLHVGDKNEYLEGHLPGAQFISTTDVSTPRGQGLSLELPPIDQLRATFEKFGVSDNSRIVVYFGKDWVSPTARIFLTLDYLGFGDRTAVLDGGLPAWRAEGRLITKEVVQPKSGKIMSPKTKSVLVDAAWVKKNLDNPKVKILDARDSQFYTGAEVGRMPRGGHIPNARSIPFSSLVEADNKFKSTSEWRKIFNQAEVKSDDVIASYCHIGQQASLVYFVARYLGYDARLYDGSFEEWSRQPELPVVKTASEKNP
jgi:thiosulfate/3-mercaptopyruvate sulfurtransferase